MLTPISCTRNVNSAGSAYQFPAANACDGNPATRTDIYLTGSAQADWLALDLGSVQAIGSVTLQNADSTLNPLLVGVGNDPTLYPQAGTTGVTILTGPGTNPQAAGSDYVFTAPAACTARYLLVRQALNNGSPSSALIGDVSAAPPSAAPLTLTATPQIVDGIPSIVLTWTGG